MPFHVTGGGGAVGGFTDLNPNPNPNICILTCRTGCGTFFPTGITILTMNDKHFMKKHVPGLCIDEVS